MKRIPPRNLRYWLRRAVCWVLGHSYAEPHTLVEHDRWGNNTHFMKRCIRCGDSPSVFGRQ